MGTLLSPARRALFDGTNLVGGRSVLRGCVGRRRCHRLSRLHWLCLDRAIDALGGGLIGVGAGRKAQKGDCGSGRDYELLHRLSPFFGWARTAARMTGLVRGTMLRSRIGCFTDGVRM